VRTCRLCVEVQNLLTRLEDVAAEYTGAELTESLSTGALNLCRLIRVVVVLAIKQAVLRGKRRGVAAGRAELNIRSLGIGRGILDSRL